MISRYLAFAAIIAASAAQAVEAPNSHWEYVPNVMLEHVLMPAAQADGFRQEASVIGSGALPLKSGLSVIFTNVRLDRTRMDGTGRNSTYWRCYEYFTTDFAPANTHCLVLKPSEK